MSELTTVYNREIMDTQRLLWEMYLSDWIKLNTTDAVGSTVNSTVVKNMYQKYLIKANEIKKPPIPTNPDNIPFSLWDPTGYQYLNYIKNELQLSHNVVNSFLLGLYDLTRKGIISREIYDPMGYAKDKNLWETIFPPLKIEKYVYMGLAAIAGIGLIVLLK